MHTRAWNGYLLNDTAILVWMAVALILIHCLTNNQYGFHRDELNFIEDGRHLAWGYIDCPPFTPFVAHIAETLFGTSLVGIRFFPAVSQGLVLVLTGLMVRRMGGNRWAQVIAAGGAVISGVSLNQGSIFMYVAFDFLWWVVVAYGVISLLKTNDARWWLAIGAAIGLGMLTKLTMTLLVAGLVAGVLFTPARHYLKSPWLWAGAAVALLVFLPNLLWMVQHDFISLQKLSAAHARDVNGGFYKWFFIDQLYNAANPSSIYLWVLGLYFFWRSAEKPNYRPLVWMYAVPLMGFLVLQGRGYYLAPAYPILIAGGAYYIGEQVRNLAPAQRSNQYSWLYYSLVIGGLCAASFTFPVMPINSFWWKWADAIHQLYREEIGWPEMVKTVAEIRDTVPLVERSRLGILAGNYGEAGAINVYGPAYNLPRAISGIDSFWLWGYGDPPPETVIVLGLKPSYADSLFETCSIAGTNANPYGIQNEESQAHPDILLCRHLRQPWDQFWKNFHYFG
ncbi:MAG TPA: glycosyltransferase family 39 protein [Anaerolineaceae bacterium]|nr:glycosyltransferase family 39 protein [Anaerolineaceae bacterium]